MSKVLFYFASSNINRTDDRVKTETRKSQASFRLFSLMRGWPSIRLKKSENEPEISLSRLKPHHRLFFSPIIFLKQKSLSMLKLLFRPLLCTCFYPRPKAEGYRFVHVHPSVLASVRPSVRPEPLLSNR